MNRPEEFWSKVSRRGLDECWPWTGALRRGYGVAKWHGRSLGAHRIAYMLLHGQVPGKMFICHKCDNPKCCNPRHLYVGDHTMNMLDKARKKRGRTRPAPGSSNPVAVLTDEKVVEIRKLYHSDPKRYSHRKLARLYGIGLSTVGRVIRGETYWLCKPDGETSES